jgi:predicted cobalt transporter CbtA
VSFDGYRIIATMLLSFFQWFLIAKFMSWLIRKFTGTRGSRSVG